MTPATILNSLEQFVIRWGGTTIPRVLVAFVGLLICVAVLIALWEQRIRIFTLGHEPAAGAFPDFRGG